MFGCCGLMLLRDSSGVEGRVVCRLRCVIGLSSSEPGWSLPTPGGGGCAPRHG